MQNPLSGGAKAKPCRLRLATDRNGIPADGGSRRADPPSLATKKGPTMYRVSTPTEPPAATLGIHPALVGTACCISSAVAYTAANICLRQLAGYQADPAWVICVKEMVTVLVVGPYLLLAAGQRRLKLPPAKVIAVLAAVGVGVQVLGNFNVQRAFGIVGLAVSMPAVFGTMLVASAVIGFFWLGERVNVRSVRAIAMLVLAIALLGVGTATTSAPSGEAGEAGPGLAQSLFGVAAACLGGVMFATLGAGVRYAHGQAVPIALIVFVITGMGVVCLGAVSLNRIGLESMAATPPDRLAWMVASGVFNLIGFLLISKGLQLTALVHANVINASQVAFGAVAGILLFREASNLWLIAGIGLTVAGIIHIGRPEQQGEVMEAV